MAERFTPWATTNDTRCSTRTGGLSSVTPQLASPQRSLCRCLVPTASSPPTTIHGGTLQRTRRGCRRWRLLPELHRLRSVAPQPTARLHRVSVEFTWSTLQLALVRRDPEFTQLRDRVIAIAGVLEKSRSVPDVARELEHLEPPRQPRLPRHSVAIRSPIEEASVPLLRPERRALEGWNPCERSHRQPERCSSLRGSLWGHRATRAWLASSRQRWLSDGIEVRRGCALSPSRTPAGEV